MSLLSKLLKSIKEFSTKYPAVLSGYVMYAYLFVTIMRFFLKAKTRELTLFEIYEVFDALPFLWLLSSALVNIIDTRTKLHSAEKDNLLALQQLEIKETQLTTMLEVAKGFQHQINGPLTIISFALRRARRAAANNKDILSAIAAIEESARRIKQTVIDFSRAEEYDVQHVGPVVGLIASPPSLKHERGGEENGHSALDTRAQIKPPTSKEHS
jgi:signal transduction histidine kinase